MLRFAGLGGRVEYALDLVELVLLLPLLPVGPAFDLAVFPGVFAAVDEHDLLTLFLQGWIFLQGKDLAAFKVLRLDELDLVAVKIVLFGGEGLRGPFLVMPEGAVVLIDLEGQELFLPRHRLGGRL